MKYQERIQEAARFARAHDYGLLSTCKTDVEGDTNELGGAETETTLGVRPSRTPVPKQTDVADSAGGITGCDLAYPDLCVPPPPPDLDCRHVYARGFRHITVLPPDPHNFDGNHPGVV